MRRTLRMCIPRRPPRRVGFVAGVAAGWRPLALTWRRHAKPPAAVAALPAHALHRYFHAKLVLSWNISNITAAAARARRARAVTAEPRHTHTLARVEHLRTTQRRVHTHQDHLRLRTASELRRELVTRNVQVVTAAPAGARARASVPVSESAARARAPRVVGKSGVAVHAAQPIATRRDAPLVRRAAPVAAHAANAARDSVRGAGRERVAAPLVWRKPAAPGAAMPAAAGSVPAAAAAATAQPARAVFATPANDARQAREAVRSSLMDTAVVDRLAEDVMKRVEKRLRIERERRGL